jgi:hypothetical protein
MIVHLLLIVQLKLQLVALMEVAAQDYWIVHLILFVQQVHLSYAPMVNVVRRWIPALPQNFVHRLKSNVLVASVLIHSLFVQPW